LLVNFELTQEIKMANYNNDTKNNTIIAVVVILVLIAGIALWNTNDNPADIEPAAGNARVENNNSDYTNR
jgi:hypothetical protein